MTANVYLCSINARIKGFVQWFWNTQNDWTLKIPVRGKTWINSPYGINCDLFM